MDNRTLKKNWRAYMNKKSLWHNKIHLEMPFGLVNDPNGLCWQDGRYQIFYQWNPAGCEHKNKHWGYTQTEDFVHYAVPQLALAPVDDFDKNGCYSGSARVRKNQLQIFYTANLKDENNVRYPRQILAVKNEDGSFSKEKIIIGSAPEGYTAHFRDPYVFSHSGRSFMILGAQRENLTGCCLIYEEIDGNWRLRGELKTNYPDFGYMWECPNFISLDGYDALLFCPQGIKAQGRRYNNLYQSGCIIGRFDPDTLEFAHGKFRELDGGFDFYAPQVLVHGGRSILFGWVGMPEREKEYPTTQEGWIHSLTLPRELHIKNGAVYQTPAKELEKLCRENKFYAACRFLNLPVPCKTALDIDLTDKIRWQGNFCLGGDILTMSFDKEAQEFCIDRSALSLGGKGRRYFAVSAREKLRLDIYLDTSIMEVYCQNGEAAATVCCYPQKVLSAVSFESNISADIAVSELNALEFAEEK